MLRREHLPALLCLFGLAMAGCQPTGGDRVGDLPVPFLQERVEEALADVEAARAAVPDDTAEASARLEASRLKLRLLDEYYLPLLAARQQVEKAAESLGADDTAVRSAVDSTEAILMEMVRTHGRHLEEEMRGSLARLEDVRTALAADDVAEARQILERLGHHLESIFFRGELVLQGSELEFED
jgi:hypothetical protein